LAFVPENFFGLIGDREAEVTATLVSGPPSTSINGSPSELFDSGSLIFAAVPAGNANELGSISTGQTLTSTFLRVETLLGRL
jgi:hypothetical protein